MSVLTSPQLLDGQHVVVVGGSSGIGLGVAAACLEAGTRVTVVGRQPDRLDRAVGELRRDTDVRAVDAVRGDATDEHDVAQLFATTGVVNHVVMTAADVHYAPVQDLDVGAARVAFDSKVGAALHVAKHATFAPGGSLVLTAGIAKDRPMRGGAITAAANGAVVSLVKALALELDGVRVNGVSPGWVDTPIWDVVAGEAKSERLTEQARRLPVGRVGTPSDIGAAVLFLLVSGFTTGEIVHVDGGHRLV